MRYCDDLVLLSAERAVLKRQEGQIGEFVFDELSLTLNDRRRLRPVSDGIDFLGYIVRPDYLLVRRRVIGACFERLARAENALIQQGLTADGNARQVYPWHWPTLEAVYRRLNSYLAHFRKASSYRLVKRLWRRFPASRLPTIKNSLWESGVPVAWIKETDRRITGIGERALVCRWPGLKSAFLAAYAHSVTLDKDWLEEVQIAVQSQKETKQRGGRRPGAGRPRRAEPKSKPIWCGQIDESLREWIIRTLSPQERLDALIEAARAKEQRQK